MTEKIYIPWTLRDPKTTTTHYQNSYADHSITLCGLDAGAWIGFNFSKPTCVECQRVDATLTRYSGGEKVVMSE